MKLRIVVVGVPGVGKSTIVQGLIAELSPAKLVTFGSVMLEQGVALGWIKHRDELRKLPVEKQRRLQKITASRIAKLREATVVVDTHLFIRTKEGFWPGLPFDVVRALKPTHLVLVEATPDEVARRRASDSTRYRDSVDQNALREELALARSFLSVSSTLTGAPMLMVNNEDGKSSEVVKDVAAVMRGASA